MPWAGNASIFDMTATERGAHVWAKVVNSVQGAVVVEYGNNFGTAFHGFAGTFWKCCERTYLGPLSHRANPLK